MKSLTAHGTEQIDPREPGQVLSGHGGRSGVGCEDGSPSVKSIPPVEVVLSSGAAPVTGLFGSGLNFLVEERVEMQIGRPERSSSELEAELMAQSVSFSGETCQFRAVRRRRVEGRPVGVPRSVEDVEG